MTPTTKEMLGCAVFIGAVVFAPMLFTMELSKLLTQNDKVRGR